METFSASLAIYAGNSPVAGEFTAQLPVTRSFHIFFDMRLNKRGLLWVSNGDVGDLIRHRAHYDVTLMIVLDGLNFTSKIFESVFLQEHNCIPISVPGEVSMIVLWAISRQLWINFNPQRCGNRNNLLQHTAQGGRTQYPHAWYCQCGGMTRM